MPPERRNVHGGGKDRIPLRIKSAPRHRNLDTSECTTMFGSSPPSSMLSTIPSLCIGDNDMRSGSNGIKCTLRSPSSISSNIGWIVL